MILPTNSSLSVTLDQDDLRSLTTARAINDKSSTSTSTTKDRLWLNGEEEEIKQGGRTFTCLQELRKLRKSFEDKDSSLLPLSSFRLHIASENNFPTAAGLASSASGLSALIKTISTLYQLSDLGISTSELSRIARQGSGSACRSMFGGYVGWEMGQQPDGSDSLAYQVLPVEEWKDLNAIILVVSDKKKGTASTVGMQRTVATSSLLQHRIKQVVPKRMETMEKAIKEKDFDTFAKETIEDSNQFHAVCLDTSPPIFYLNDVSRSIIQLVEELNRSTVQDGKGLVAAYTYDAGPNAVLYVQQRNVNLVLSTVLKYFPQEQQINCEEQALPQGFNEKIIQKQDVGAVSRIIHTRVGDGPRTLDTEKEGLLAANGLPKNLVA